MFILNKNISQDYNQDILQKKFPIESYSVLEEKVLDNLVLKTDKYLEISHKYTPIYKLLSTKFGNANFVSDEPFEAMLAYHDSVINNKNLTVFNYQFSSNGISALQFNEEFDFIISHYGLCYNELFSLLPNILNMLKIDGFLCIIMPYYWFFRENLSHIESSILTYSKQSDKAWVFQDDIRSIITDNNADIVEFSKFPQEYTLDRRDLAYLSSLSRLYSAEINQDIAILDIIDIPRHDIKLQSAMLLIKKTASTITKDNLFK